MRVKCKNCGFIYDKFDGEKCPKCGCRHWTMNLGREKVDRESLEMVTNLLGEAYDMAKLFLKEKGYVYSEKMGVLPMKERVEKEGLAFEIFDIKDQKKVNIREIYFDETFVSPHKPVLGYLSLPGGVSLDRLSVSSNRVRTN